MGKYIDYFELYDKFIELNSDGKKTLYHKKALTLFFLERYNEALVAVNSALKLESENIECINLKGIFS